MNQRGAVRAVSIVSGLAIFIGVLVLPSLTGLVGAADQGAECDLPEAISIKVPLRDGSKEEVPLPEPIVAGIGSGRSPRLWSSNHPCRRAALIVSRS